LAQPLPLARRLSLAIGKRTPVKPVRSRLTRAVASLSFDDVPRSATLAGAAVLEAAGARGSYYVCGSHTGRTFEGADQHRLDDLSRLADAGHEIGCHTYAHLDATLAGYAARLRDHAANRAFAAEALAGEAPSTFAYPYGSTSLRSKLFYSKRFLACRGVRAGLNAGLIDLAELRAVPIESHRFDVARVRDLAAEARERRGWLVFFTHDVAPEPTRYGCRREELEAVVGALADADIEVLTVRDAARRVLAG
jgi:peptidoglycan/xylan/chitin deacetylase (PgdA/CDA1 family)